MCNMCVRVCVCERGEGPHIHLVLISVLSLGVPENH